VGTGDIFAFGPFQLDTRTRRLSRNGEPVVLTDRQIELLCLLVSKAGQVLSKDVLIEAAWQGVAVTDNSLEQAISSLRRSLAAPPGQPYVETVARRGYRLSADVTRVDRRETDQALDALLAPHRAWIEGRAALETLEQDPIVRARAVFEGVLSHVPHHASAHVGLANACAMQFEMTRSDPVPDADVLARALHHATEACRLDPQYGEAWVTLGFVLDRTGNHRDALAASRRAVVLEGDTSSPSPVVRKLGRGAPSRGAADARAASRLPAGALAGGVRLRRAPGAFGGRTGASGRPCRSRWTSGQAEPVQRRGAALALGLIHLARGDDRRALDEFDRELSYEGGGHLYARECCANTWYAIGAVRLRQGDLHAAGAAFQHAMARVPKHPMAQVGLAAVNNTLPRAAAYVSTGSNGDQFRAASVSIDLALPRAVQLVLAGAPEDAARIVDQALADAAPGSAGWLLPVEPVLCALADRAVWSAALSRVRNRSA
jgi:DNA-binding winged helix-turn-helix (wHTH) protein